jgi:hypothetical protein
MHSLKPQTHAYHSQTTHASISCVAEAAYCDMQVVNEVVLPLLSMQDSCLLCISTLLPSSNHYSRMFEVTGRDGKRIFESIQISLVCEDCLKTEHPELCTHKLSEMPRWLSSQKLEVIKALLSEDPALCAPQLEPPSSNSSPPLHRHGRKRPVPRFPTYSRISVLRESMGVSADETVRAFKEPAIKAFVERIPLQVPMISNVFMSIDPSGGGPSAFAVCSIVLTSTGLIAVRATRPPPFPNPP